MDTDDPAERGQLLAELWRAVCALNQVVEYETARWCREHPDAKGWTYTEQEVPEGDTERGMLLVGTLISAATMAAALYPQARQAMQGRLAAALGPDRVEGVLGQLAPLLEQAFAAAAVELSDDDVTMIRALVPGLPQFEQDGGA